MTAAFSWTSARGVTTQLHEGQYRVMHAVSGLDAVPVSTNWEPYISFDGASDVGDTIGVRPVGLPVRVRADVEDLQAQVRYLVGQLKDGPGTLTATIDGRTSTLSAVKAVVTADVRSKSSLTDRVIGFSLTAGDPWWQGPVMSSFLTLGERTASDDAAVASDDPLTPSAGGGTSVVSADGDADPLPVLVITGPFTTLTVGNSTTGGFIELAGPLAAGATMFVDARPTARGPRMDGGAVDNRLLTAQSRAFGLAAGQNVFAVSSSGSTGASVVEVRWRNRWSTP